MSPRRSIAKTLREFLAFHGPRTRVGTQPLAPSEGELLLELAKENPGNLLFGRFGEDEVLSRLDRAGILAGVAARGHRDPVLSLDCRDPSEHRVCLFAGARSRDRLLLEARLSLCRFSPRRAIGPFPPDSSFRMLILNWLVLSDPGRPFAVARPRLPGQEHPGLGLLSQATAFLRDLTRELSLDGALSVPFRFHTALFCARAFRFLDPEAEGRTLAMARDLAGPPLALVSEAIALGCLVDPETGELLPWTPAEQVLPGRGPLGAYLRSTAYRDARDRGFARFRCAIDWNAYRAKIAALGAAGKYP